MKSKQSLGKVDRLNIASIGSNIVNAPLVDPKSNSKVSKIPITAVKFGGVQLPNEPDDRYSNQNPTKDEFEQYKAKREQMMKPPISKTELGHQKSFDNREDLKNKI